MFLAPRATRPAIAAYRSRTGARIAQYRCGHANRARVWTRLCTNHGESMGKLTTHVLNLTTGEPAARMRVELHDRGASPPRLLAEAVTDEQGRCSRPLLADDALRVGRYTLTFHVAEYFRSVGLRVAQPPFLDGVVIAFGVANADENYHIPLLTTPWSYSTYRGS